jgi:putative NADH-flavin reductase
VRRSRQGSSLKPDLSTHIIPYHNVADWTIGVGLGCVGETVLHLSIGKSTNKGTGLRMRLAVFGGSRGTGLHLIEKALVEGHEITALARYPDGLRERFPDIQVVQGDVFNVEDTRATVKGSEAVISTLGFVGRSKETTIYSEGVLNIARVIQELGPRRLIVLAASQGIDPHPDFPWYASIMMKLLIKPMFGFAYRDMARMADLLLHSDTDWTLVGVPMLTNSSKGGHYRSSIGKPLHHAFRISRADVAGYLLSIIKDKTTFRNWTEIAW